VKNKERKCPYVILETSPSLRDLVTCDLFEAFRSCWSVGVHDLNDRLCSCLQTNSTSVVESYGQFRSHGTYGTSVSRYYFEDTCLECLLLKHGLSLWGI
jgi:hypothetical protein